MARSVCGRRLISRARRCGWTGGRRSWARTATSFPLTESLAARVARWQRRHGRHDLPWQRRPTAYAVWLSETMLQQTQVATVIPYYRAFIRRFPTVSALARATEDEVLALWSGLGYYARARHLHAAARQMAAHGLPPDLSGWRALPGVGRSTAAAVRVFAYGERQAILDGNVKKGVCAGFCG